MPIPMSASSAARYSRTASSRRCRLSSNAAWPTSVSARTMPVSCCGTCRTRRSSGCFVLFPDPWPKKRHVKRRLVNRGLFDQLARVMRPGGELRIGTDIADYLRTMLLAARGRADFAWQVQGAQDWRLRPADWPQTRYEAKAIREGRRCYFLRFIRTDGVPSRRSPLNPRSRSRNIWLLMIISTFRSGPRLGPLFLYWRRRSGKSWPETSRICTLAKKAP